MFLESIKYTIKGKGDKQQVKSGEQTHISRSLTLLAPTIPIANNRGHHTCCGVSAYKNLLFCNYYKKRT